MQRKIDQYWKRKDNTKGTVSAVASKVQRTVSDFGAQTSTTSDHQSTQQEQAYSILFQESSSIIYPLTWNEQQYEEFKRKNSWMYAINGKIGCIFCREVNNLGMRASRGVIISARWAEGNVTSCGSTRQTQLSSLRKKLHEHKDSQAHKEAINILESAKKDVLLNLNAQSEQAVFQSTARVFKTAYYVAKNNKPFTDFESLIDLQEGNSLDMGRVLHSKTVAFYIIDHVSSQMKKKTFN